MILPERPIAANPGYLWDTQNQGPRTTDQGPRTTDQGPRTKDQGSRSKDQGSSIKVQGPRIKDHGPCFGTNEHPRRDTGAISRLSKSTIEGLSKCPCWVAQNPLPKNLVFLVHWFWIFRFTGSGIFGFRCSGQWAQFLGFRGRFLDPEIGPSPPLLDQSRALCFQYKCLGKMQFYPFRADGPGADFGGSPGRRLFFFDFFLFLIFGPGFFCKKSSRKS